MGKTEKRYYDINGLVSFSIEGTTSKVDYVHRQYSYFLVDKEPEKIDIEISVGKFNEQEFLSKQYEVVNRKYKIAGDCIFAEDTYKVAKWKFMIADLCADKTKIYFDGNYWGYYILYKFFIEPVIRLKLAQKGYFMIHSSSVLTDGEAFVFPASPSVGKTSTMLNWLRQGMAFIADEYTIIGKEGVYSYPTPLRLHDYNLKANPYICDDMSFNDKFQIYLRTWIFRLTFGYGDITHEVDIWNVFRNVKIVNHSQLRKLVIFTKYNGADLQVKTISKKRLIEKLLIIDRFETTRFNEYLDAYYYINDVPAEEQFWNKMRDNAEKIFMDDEYSEFNIPASYSEKTFQQINKALGY